jgi:hypothetical protein
VAGPFAKRRVVIPAAGYYEWLPTEDPDGKPVKRPYYIHPADATLSFAGLYELWPDPAKDPDDPDRWLWSAAIITHHATWLAGVMNDRTPVSSPVWPRPPKVLDLGAVLIGVSAGQRATSPESSVQVVTEDLGA